MSNSKPRYDWLLVGSVIAVGVVWYILSNQPAERTTARNDQQKDQPVNLTDTLQIVPPAIESGPGEVGDITPPSGSHDRSQTDSNEVEGPSDDSSVLTLNLSGSAATEGEFRVAIFSEKEGFPDHKKADYTAEFPVTEGNSPQISIPSGKYAIAVYHDVNSDDVLNKGAFGIPSEVYGFSNNARATFGPPGFSAALMTIERGPQTTAIRLK